MEGRVVDGEQMIVEDVDERVIELERLEVEAEVKDAAVQMDSSRDQGDREEDYNYVLSRLFRLSFSFEDDLLKV